MIDHDNEFTKPLRGVADKSKRSSFRPALVAIGIGILCAIPVVQFYGGLSKVTGHTSQPIDTASTEELPEEKVGESQNQVSEETTAAISKREYDVDPSGGNLQQLDPVGEIVPVTPKPMPQPLPKAANVKRQELAMAHLPEPSIVERGASGVIPKISSDGLRAMDVYSRQPDTEGNFGVARVVIVIGGLGISQTSTQEAITSLPPNVTLAFAPYGNSLTRWMQKARKSGHELLLQIPMEPLDFPKNNPGPHTLKAAADLEENLANLHWAMSRITNYVGVTNYLGQKILQQPASLSPVFSEIAKRGLLFFEDGSVKNSMGPGVAVKELVPYAKANILIDNVRSRAAIADKLNRLSEQAKRTGVAIGMGNAFPDTIAMVAEYAKHARRNGIEITPVSAVVKDPRK